MKKIIAVFLAALLAAVSLAACGGTDAPAPSESAQEGGEPAGLKIVTTGFPVCDWTRAAWRKNGRNWPEDYPEEGETIIVTGIYNTYEEDGGMYCTLREARLEG